MDFDLLKSGIEENGRGIEDTGILPTPAIALLTQQSPCGGGVMISASHNSFEDNGIKIFGAKWAETQSRRKNPGSRDGLRN